MPCYHPKTAWTTPYGAIFFTAPKIQSWAQGITTQIQLPCGNCIGCIKAHAQAWALRCRLELLQHDKASFTTLTYDEKHKPPTLSKRHLQLYLKRLRKATNKYIRFFASGEYGERRRRAHYHLLLFGIDPDDPEIQNNWPYGFTESSIVTPARISYCAGYTDKKAEQRYHSALPYNAVSSDGEPYRYQPPFIQMSRGGRHGKGIASVAREDYVSSWEYYAIKDGHKMAVPRYFKEQWKFQATDQEIQRNKEIKRQYALTRYNDYNQLEAAEKIAHAQQTISASKRKY